MFAIGERLGSSFISSVLEGTEGSWGRGQLGQTRGLLGRLRDLAPHCPHFPAHCALGNGFGMSVEGSRAHQSLPSWSQLSMDFSLHSKQTQTLSGEGIPKSIRFEIQDLVLASAAGPDLISLDPDTYEQKTKSIYILF